VAEVDLGLLVGNGERAHDVGAAHDTDQTALRDDRQPVHVVLGHQLRGAQERHVGSYRERLSRHHLGDGAHRRRCGGRSRG
jgi:hypothetical protein